MGSMKFAFCSVCGYTIAPARGPRSRAGLTALHYRSRAEMLGTARERRCPGSDLPFAAHEPLEGPRLPANVIRVDFRARRRLPSAPTYSSGSLPIQ